MIDKKFIANLKGKDFVLFDGLLAMFHENKGKSIETEELPNSTSESPKFKATVTGERGTFTGHGDADSKNTNAMIGVHKYRMAETRAIARALRWYNNIGMCSVDELGGSEDNSDQKATQTPPVNVQPKVVAKSIMTTPEFKNAIFKLLESKAIKMPVINEVVIGWLEKKYIVPEKFIELIQEEVNTQFLIINNK